MTTYSDLDAHLDRIKRQYAWRQGMPLTPPPLPSQRRKTVLKKKRWSDTIILTVIVGSIAILTAAIVIKIG